MHEGKKEVMDIAPPKLLPGRPGKTTKSWAPIAN